MKISFNQVEAEFRPWSPGQGIVFKSLYAFDSETTLIDRSRPWITPTYVLGAAFDGQQGVFITRDNLQAFLKTHDGIPVVMHHARFDLRVIDELIFGLDIYDWVDRDLVWDTQLLYRLLLLGTEGHTASGKGQSSTLEHCVERYLGQELPKSLVDEEGDNVRLSYGKWLGRPEKDISNVYLEYLAKDTMATQFLYQKLKAEISDLLQTSSDLYGHVSSDWLEQQIRRWGPLTHHTQLKASIVLDRITANGLHIDVDKVDQLSKSLSEVAHRLKGRLRDQGYLPGQPGSGKAMQLILKRLEREHSTQSLPRTPTGKYATSREALEECGELEFVADYLKYKEIEKLKSTFLKKLNQPCIHPSFGVLVVSGRTSSFGAINSQNLPRNDEVRSCFIPSKGHVFIDADYNTLEMASLSQVVLSQLQQPSHMAGVINAGRDLHRLVAARVTGKAESEVSKEDRQRAKPINFGKPGGMGNAGLKQYAKSSYGIELTDDEVEEFTSSWFDLFPEMREFLRRESDLGEDVACLFGLTPASHCEHTSSNRFLRQELDVADARQPSGVLGWMFLKALRSSEPISRRGNPYRQEDIDYFWACVEERLDLFPEKLKTDIGLRRPSEDLARFVRQRADQGGCITMTGRVRAKASFCARHNTLFQGLAADGAKIALWKLWRSGFRIVNFIHDEVLVEVPENSDLDHQADSIRTLMVDGMKEVITDLRIDVEYSVAHAWYKDAQLSKNASGKIVPWVPSAESKTATV